MVDINDNLSQKKIEMNSPKDTNDNDGYETIQQPPAANENDYEITDDNRYENDKADHQYENDKADHQYENTNENQYEKVGEERTSRRSSRAPSPTGSYHSRCSRTSSMRPESPDFIPEVFPAAGLLLDADAEKKYECMRCKKVLCHPVQIQSCSHRVCYLCFKEINDDEPPQCPTCNKEVDVATLDKAFWDEIQDLEVKCKNFEWGCKWEGEVKNFEDHDESCGYTDILCKFDCGSKFQQRFETKHLDKDCPKQLITCPYCSDKHLREAKKSHFEECPDFPLPCPNKCDKKLTFERSKLENHVDNECPRTKILCMFENIGCAHRASREKMTKHYTKETSSHVKLLFGMLLKQEQSLGLHDERLQSSEASLMEQDKRIGDLEKIAHSQLIWRIEDYTRKLKECKAGNVDSLFSPTFTTSKHGYRLCASVCLNGDGKGKGTHMSVFVSVLKGHFDSLLKWPFEYRVTFILLDQNDNNNERKHIKFSIKPNPCPENEPFLGRPKMEKNASFGGAKFARHEDIESGGYVKDDVIFIKIVVDCDGLSEP